MVAARNLLRGLIHVAFERPEVSVMIWEEGRNEPDLLHDATIQLRQSDDVGRQFITTAMERNTTTKIL